MAPPADATLEALNTAWQSYAKTLTETLSDAVAKQSANCTLTFAHNLKSRNRSKQVTARIYHSGEKIDEIVFELPHQNDVLNLPDDERIARIKKAADTARQSVQNFIDASSKEDEPAQPSDYAEKSHVIAWMSHGRNLTRALTQAVAELNSDCTVECTHNGRSRANTKKILTAQFYYKGEQAASVDFEMPSQDEVLVLSSMEWNYRVDTAVTVARLVVKDLINRGFQLTDAPMPGRVNDASNVKAISLDDAKAADQQARKKAKAQSDSKQSLASKKRKDLPLITDNTPAFERALVHADKVPNPGLAMPEMTVRQFLKLVNGSAPKTSKLSEAENKLYSQIVKPATPSASYNKNFIFNVHHLARHLKQSYSDDGRKLEMGETITHSGAGNGVVFSFFNNGWGEAIVTLNATVVTLPREVLRLADLHKNPEMRKPVLLLHGQMGNIKDKHPALYVLDMEESDAAIDKAAKVADAILQKLKDHDFLKKAAKPFKLKKPAASKAPAINLSEQHKLAAEPAIQSQPPVVQSAAPEEQKTQARNAKLVDGHILRTLGALTEHAKHLEHLHVSKPMKDESTGEWIVEFRDRSKKDKDKVVSSIVLKAVRKADTNYKILLTVSGYAADNPRKNLLQYTLDNAPTIGKSILKALAEDKLIPLGENDPNYLNGLKQVRVPTVHEAIEWNDDVTVVPEAKNSFNAACPKHKKSILTLKNHNLEQTRAPIELFIERLAYEYDAAYGSGHTIIVSHNLDDSEAPRKGLRVKFHHGKKLEALLNLDIVLNKNGNYKTPALIGKAMSDETGIGAFDVKYEVHDAEGAVEELAEDVINHLRIRGLLKEAQPAQGMLSAKEAARLSKAATDMVLNPTKAHTAKTRANAHYNILREAYYSAQPRTKDTTHTTPRDIPLIVPPRIDYQAPANEALRKHVENTVDIFHARIERNCGHHNFIQSVETAFHDGGNQLTIRMRIREPVKKDPHRKHPSVRLAFNSRIVTVKGYITVGEVGKGVHNVGLSAVQAKNAAGEWVMVDDFKLRGISDFLTNLGESGAVSKLGLKRKFFRSKLELQHVREQEAIRLRDQKREEEQHRAEFNTGSARTRGRHDAGSPFTI